MAIGTLAAIAIGAGAIGSAAISSSASKKASQAATQAADQSAAVQREIYGQNKDMLSPWVGQGQAATSQINALLGIDNGDNYQAFLPQKNAMIDYGSFNPFGGGGFATTQPEYTPEEIAAARQRAIAANRTNAENAFNTYKNNTGYQFRFNEGMRALNGGLASNGMLKSGSAVKSALNFGQGIASSEFGNYLNSLGNQQGVGLSAGGSLAGVSTNYANTLGNIYQNRADAVGNAALVNASNMNGMINGLTSGIFKYGVK